LIKSETGAHTALVEGARGEFSVWVGDERVAEKTGDLFPTDQDVLAAVRRALVRR